MTRDDPLKIGLYKLTQIGVKSTSHSFGWDAVRLYVCQTKAMIMLNLSHAHSELDSLQGFVEAQHSVLQEKSQGSENFTSDEMRIHFRGCYC